MVDIDQRILRAGVEVSGAIQWYEGLQVTARGAKVVSDIQNSCDVEIVNLSRETRNYILTETSPFNPNRTPKRLIIEAGRVSTGVSRIFYGDITASSPTAPPDIGLRLQAQTGAYVKGDLVARQGGAQEMLSDIAARVASDLGAGLLWEATDKRVANYSFTGAALRQVNALADAGGVDAYLDDTTLIVKDRGVALVNRAIVVNATTGMIGQPEATERGVRVKILFSPGVDLGGLITLTSELNSALDGAYTIYKLDFDLAYRTAPWYLQIEASRNE